MRILLEVCRLQPGFQSRDLFDKAADTPTLSMACPSYSCIKTPEGVESEGLSRLQTMSGLPETSHLISETLDVSWSKRHQ